MMPLSCKIIKQVENKLEKYSVDARNIYHKKNSPQDSMLKKTKKEAESFIIKAEQEAKKIIDEAKKRATDIEKEASQNGYEKGYKEGYQKGQKEAVQKVQKEAEEIYKSAKQVLSQAEDIREDTYKDIENEILKLAVDISEKIISRQLDLVPETIVSIVRNACQTKRESKIFIIYVNPDYVEILRTKKKEIISELDFDVRIQIISDANIECGGCRVENESGFIDATINTMLKKIGLTIKGEA